MPLYFCKGIRFMEEKELIPNLFRTEFRKIVSVLCGYFGIEQVGIAEDIASDTFLSATELWGQKGLPANPTAWLYTVAKNKTKDYLKHNSIFRRKVSGDIMYSSKRTEDAEIDLSNKNILDSQLAMMFAICDPSISKEAQISLSLNLLCGFGVEEIADAFLTNKETIYKRLARAKEKLREEKIKIEIPSLPEIHNRIETVLLTLYLLFSEGYYSASENTALRKGLCTEAMRLTLMLIDNPQTNTPSANALMSLMCFHSSRFEARENSTGEMVLYEDQDESLWDKELVAEGNNFLIRASKGNQLTRYHLEAAIAYWHTHKEDTNEKWENILQLYNQLLQIEYSPIAALNRTYALAKANGKKIAIAEAEKLNLCNSHFYHTLLGYLYVDIDHIAALQHLQKAFILAKSNADKKAISKNIAFLSIPKKNNS